MYDRSSRVSGSMIWYSSSMPSVREGACMQVPCVGLSPFSNERGGLTSTARGDVEQRCRAQPRQYAVHVIPVSDVRCGIHHSIDQRELAVHDAGVAFHRQLDTLLNDVRLA